MRMPPHTLSIRMGVSLVHNFVFHTVGGLRQNPQWDASNLRCFLGYHTQFGAQIHVAITTDDFVGRSTNSTYPPRHWTFCRLCNVLSQSYFTQRWQSTCDRWVRQNWNPLYTRVLLNKVISIKNSKAATDPELFVVFLFPKMNFRWNAEVFAGGLADGHSRLFVIS